MGDLLPVDAHRTATRVVDALGRERAGTHVAPPTPGTPAGTATARGRSLRPGELMVAEIDGVGRLENRIVAAGDEG